MTITRLFISYAHRDGRDLATRLHTELADAGYTVWLNTADIDSGASCPPRLGKSPVRVFERT